MRPKFFDRIAIVVFIQHENDNEKGLWQKSAVSSTSATMILTGRTQLKRVYRICRTVSLFLIRHMANQPSPKRKGAPRGSFLSHPSLPSLLGSRSAVLHRTMSAVPAGEPVVARLSRQRCFLGRLPPHDIAFRLRRLHRMRLLPLIRHSSHLLHAMAFSAKAF